MLHWKMKRLDPRPITKNRIAAAQRHLVAERERLALFADQVEIEQPSAVERIEAHDARFAKWHESQRMLRAQSWRKARKRLAALAEDKRHAVEWFWRRNTYPLDPGYLNALIHRVESGQLDPVREQAELERLRKLGEAARSRITANQQPSEVA